MRRLASVLAGLAAVAGGVATSPALAGSQPTAPCAEPAPAQTGPAPASAATPDDPGQLTEYCYSAAGLPPRDYFVYVPNLPEPTDGWPILVFLHGCEQNSRDVALGTRFDNLADHPRAGMSPFVVVYPQQTVAQNSSAPLADGNGAACWNWFLPEDQHAGSGEPATIAGITNLVRKLEDGDRRRVYVDGISAGADMSVILGATYPNVYAAIGAVAGCAYATCADETGQLAYQEMQHAPGGARVVPAFVEQGTGDTLNAFPLGQGLVQGWLGTDDLADDGQMNGSVSHTPTSIQNFDFSQTPQPGTGNICEPKNSTFPCPGGAVGFQGSYPYTVEHFGSTTVCPTQDVLQFWVVHGLEHAYPDGDYRATFTDPLGPDITTAAWTFFSQHPMDTCKTGGGHS
ncbi:MAG TPA: PHB depolymerase family esterase [Acidimicrobiales bacterium]|nr:PHB depolymerase family esterase [Acidimicrobiales bacterium]